MSNIMDFYAEKYGLGIVLAGNDAGIGRYEIATASGDTGSVTP